MAKKVILPHKVGKTDFAILNAGSFWSDGGAAMGPLPKVIWQKHVSYDDKNRIEFPLNLLLIISEGKKIIVDTGVGNRVSEKMSKINNVQPWKLIENLESVNLSREEIDYVILTHLHFDHAGGIVSNFGLLDELTFPNATHIIQKKEWKIAKNPDGLNKAAYQFEHHLSLLEKSGKYLLVEDNYVITSEVKVELVAGHSNGLQAVRIESGEELAIYPGDIFPCSQHLKLPVISAYDVNRTQSYNSKEKIFNELSERNGRLLYNHDPEQIWHQF